MPPAATCKASEQKLAEDQSATGPGSMTHTCVSSARGRGTALRQEDQPMLHGTFEASVGGLHEPFVHPSTPPQKKNTKRVIKMAQEVKGTCL